MKYLGVIVLGALFSQVSMAAMYADNTVTGSCTQILGTKKHDSRRANSNKTDIKPLKKILKETGEFTINQLGTYAIKNKFVRIIPFANDPLKYKDHQITAFASEFMRLSEENPDIPMAVKEIAGDLDIKLRYSKSSGKPQIHVVVTGLRNDINTNNEFEHYSFSHGKAYARVELDIFFNYQDYSYSGFLGLPGYLNDEIEKDDIETHKVTLVTECNFTLDEVVDDSDRNSEKKDNKKEKKQKEEKLHENPEAEDFGTIFVGGQVIKE